MDREQDCARACVRVGWGEMERGRVGGVQVAAAHQPPGGRGVRCSTHTVLLRTTTRTAEPWHFSRVTAAASTISCIRLVTHTCLAARAKSKAALLSTP